MLKDLEQLKKKNVTLFYYGDSSDDLMFQSELEYWNKNLGWKIHVSIKHKPKNQDWPFMIGDFATLLNPDRIPRCKNYSSDISFVSVHTNQMIQVGDKLLEKGYPKEYINWFS